MVQQRPVGSVWLVVEASALALALSACASGDGTAGSNLAGSSGEVLGSAASSCVETYSLQTLTGRDFAFDGTVVEIGPPGSGGDDVGYSAVTFEVHEWFRGGDAGTVTVALAPPDAVSSGGAPGGDSPGFSAGTRLLVSGEPRWGAESLDEPIGWTCVFTRYRDEETSAQWRAALRS